MKIQILRDTVAGGQAVKAGQVVDASDADARYLIAVGKAEMATPKPDKSELSESSKRKPRTKVISNGAQTAIP